jgi:hypothetical protein
MLAALFLVVSVSLSVCGGDDMRVIDDGCKLPDDERESYSRYVNFRPADGAVVHLNPPRFSWPYLPDTVPESTSVPEQIFTFQISSTQDFSDVHMEGKDVPYNFYNALPALGSPSARKKWYWRVGYNVGMKDERWSSIRSFIIDEDAIVWDRSVLADPDLASIGHPRILFNSNTLGDIRLLKDSHPESKVIAEGVRERADEVMSSSWWRKFPEKDDVDSKELGRDYFHMAHDMLVVAFAYILFEDPKYLECKERFLRMASWEKGGYASPEAAGGRTEDATQTNEFLALFFDWFYNDLSDEERQIMINSLEWRIDHIVNEFSWRRREDGTHHPHSVSLICFSHGFEALMDTLPACLAAYEHSQIARDAFHLGVNYLMGITNGFGFEEGWNEGSGYGNSKMGWLMNATIYFDTAIPGIDFSKNPFYRTIGDFFCRIAPVGLQHTSFGNGGFRQSRIHSNRARNFRELAYLTGDGRFLTNRKQTFKMQGRENRPYYHHPWVEYVLPYYYERLQESVEDSGTKLFKIAGWVTVDSELPSLYDDHKDAVGMIFHCRPRGGYSHSFFNENAFDIFAYGQVIAHGGGTTDNQDKYADQTMSHNSVLIDGVGQYQFRYWPLSQVGGRYHRVPHDRVGYIAAFDETDDYVYWVGDATNAYETIPYLKRFRRHVLFMKGKYFVIFDDLATDPDHEPSRFYWLYHIYPDASVGEGFIPSHLDKAEFKYQIGETHVKVKHIASSDDLTCEDRRGLDGLINPVTGEDYREFGKGEVLFQHNIWVSNSTPTNEFRFLVVVFPYRDGDPEPMITALDDMTVRIQYGSETDTISYDAGSPHQPDIVVDYRALR